MVLLAKHNNTNIPTMMEPFSFSAAWFLWMSVPHPREPTRKGLDKAVVEGFNSLTPKSCYGGDKKSVLLAKHSNTNIPTMMKPFSSSAAWF